MSTGERTPTPPRVQPPRHATFYTLPWWHLRNPLLRVLLHLTHRLAERLLGLTRLNQLYRQALQAEGNDAFPQRILNALDLHVCCDERDRDRIPERQPLVVVANHPFGAVEGLALLELIRSRRKDVKVLANYVLQRIPELREDLLFVDPFGRPDSAARNVQAMRQALQWLRRGGALIIFPAGEVASFTTQTFQIRDPAWHISTLTLVRRAAVDVTLLPAFIPGAASTCFHLAGKIHPRLRTLLLPREMLRMQHQTIELRLGTPFSSTTLFKRFGSDAEVMRYLRFRTFLLAGRVRSTRFEERMRRLTLDTDERPAQPIINPITPEALEAEWAALPSDCHLFSDEVYALYAAQGRFIPTALREIGRLREETFRAVGEGTGKDVDTDTFDDAYYQIVLWHRERREIIGCYRLALSDMLTEDSGPNALYTRTLFRFDENFLGRLPGPAVELGRSFIRAQDQRAFAPLLLLWRGVLTFLAKHPRYTVLFGPVSISHDFSPAARDLLLTYLRATAFDETIARWVLPRLPPKKMRFAEWRHTDYADFLSNENEVNSALAELEGGHREMPVLIRQYLKIGGRIVAFNVDPDFGTVVDGLIVVNLLAAPPKNIARYMGPELYEAYRNTPREHL
ncbi:MAG: lysophospholipid acyltransferase family protein [Candidatus Spyradenecus sp.]